MKTLEELEFVLCEETAVEKKYMLYEFFELYLFQEFGGHYRANFFIDEETHDAIKLKMKELGYWK